MCQRVLRLRYECQGLRAVYQVNEVGRMNKGEGKRKKKRKVIDICGLLLCSIMINDIVRHRIYADEGAHNGWMAFINGCDAFLFLLHCLHPPRTYPLILSVYP